MESNTKKQSTCHTEGVKGTKNGGKGGGTSKRQERNTAGKRLEGNGEGYNPKGKGRYNYMPKSPLTAGPLGNQDQEGDEKAYDEKIEEMPGDDFSDSHHPPKSPHRTRKSARLGRRKSGRRVRIAREKPRKTGRCQQTVHIQQNNA